MHEKVGRCECSEEKAYVPRKMLDKKIPAFTSYPYEDPDCRNFKWHAVVKTNTDDTAFIGAANEEDLKACLSSLQDVKKILMIVNGDVIDFAEKRAVDLRHPSSKQLASDDAANTST